mgnify:FL=1|tara:strand:- start:36 stop:1037 length:1002 start_codon:yes stop_codon:yes gene_type:complete
MSELRINNITDTAGSSGPIISGVSTVSSTSHMVMPSGPTEMRGGRGRAIVFAGATPSAVTTIDAFNTVTIGNAFDFGEASAARYNNGFGGCASATRGVIADGTLMEYVVFSSGGGSNDFGDHRLMGGGTGTAAIGHAADGVRGLLAGGYIAPSNLNTIDFITIATTGSTSEYGEFDDGSTGNYSPMASHTRAVFARAGQNLNFINFTSGGKTEIFGDMRGDSRTGHIASCSNSTRGIMAGGEAPSRVNTITFITLATLGNPQDFGDLTAGRNDQDASSSSTRGFIVAGNNGSITNSIDFITFSSAGNAQDFGDLTQARSQPSSCSDVHGGIGD